MVIKQQYQHSYRVLEEYLGSSLTQAPASVPIVQFGPQWKTFGTLVLNQWSVTLNAFLVCPQLGGSSTSPSSPAAATPLAVGEAAKPVTAKLSSSDSHPASENRPQPPAASPSHPQPQPSPAPIEEPTKDAPTVSGVAVAAASPVSDRHSPAVPQPARTPGSDEVRSETTEGVTEWVLFFFLRRGFILIMYFRHHDIHTYCSYLFAF